MVFDPVVRLGMSQHAPHGWTIHFLSHLGSSLRQYVQQKTAPRPRKANTGVPLQGKKVDFSELSVEEAEAAIKNCDAVVELLSRKDVEEWYRKYGLDMSK